MKTSKPITSLTAINTSGDARKLISDVMLAIVRGEAPRQMIDVVTKGTDAQVATIQSEINYHKSQVALKQAGLSFGEVRAMGQFQINGERPDASK